MMKQMESEAASMIEIVRCRSSLGMVRLKTFTSSRPLRRLHMIRKSRLALVVLTPPPVEPGEAPMNIRVIIIRRVSLESIPMSTVLKPAVRGVIAWNRDASTRFCHGRSFKIRLCSNTKNSTAPPAINTAVATRTTLV